MGYISILLTVFMVIDCLFLILLVLMQLPKKEAGAGLAFGGAATDALFGAGSGNLLTKATKYAAGIFFVFAVILSVLQSQYFRRSGSDFRRGLEEQGKAAPPAVAPAAPPTAATPPTATGPSTNVGLLIPIQAGTNAEATNVPPKK